MKVCPNCGSQVQENATVCPNCNTSLNAGTPQSNQSASTGAKVQNRNIVVCILLSLVTCGIYGIIWYVNMVNDVNTVCQDEKSNQSGGTVFLLTLVTCGIYGIIWFFNAGKRLAVAGTRDGKQVSDNSTLYLILSLIGLQIVDYCLVQSDLNKFA